MIARKQKKCRICKEPFSGQGVVCSLKHAIELAKLQREKKQRKIDREHKVRLRSRAKWLELTQEVINKYVRLRDGKDGCISCHRSASWGGQWHASHFRSVGAASAVRFNLWNIHKSCSICNKWKSGNLSDYEPRLRAKIGDEKVDWLRTQNQTVTYDVEYLQRLIRIVRKKIKRRTKWKLNSCKQWH
jgi:hypothetical protein